MTKTLRDLIDNLQSSQVISTSGDLDCVVAAPVVESDTDLLPGGVFMARRGLSRDGHDFIPDAIGKGAAAIVGEAPMTGLPVPYVQVRDSQAAIGCLSAAFHDYPSRKLTVVGITGTDGKTTTSHLLHAILKMSPDVRAGFISTIAADFGDHMRQTGLHVTTPGAPLIQAYLAEMVAAGLTHVVLEMTSHGLAQGRLNGVELDVAVLTNITHEHLDYHGSWENYRDAKAILFHMLSSSARRGQHPTVSVLNADDPSYDYFAAIPAGQHLSYSLHSAADYKVEAITYGPDGTDFTVGGQQMRTQLVGEFNVYNVLAALTAARSLDISYEVIVPAVASVQSVTGRMQRIDEGQPFTVIVDFAHTPNALHRALEAARLMLPSGRRLIAVFGSAGLRDVEKRRLMAQNAAHLADFSILTAEDPRTESLDVILQTMADASVGAGGLEGQTFIRMPDRGRAIYLACQMAQPGDIVMVCGKGHEQSMCFGTIEHPWDDPEAVRSALRGAPLLTLPTAGEGHA